MKDNFIPVRAEILICFVLVVALLAVYGQTVGHEFVRYDDTCYVTMNPHVQAGLTRESIIWAFAATHAANWHPVTWLSHMIDVQLYGISTSAGVGLHHLTNVFFHILNTLLLFLVFRQMTEDLWQGAFVAALFALHPLHVESVAWVAERKDVLSTFFGLLTLWCYARYVEHPGIKNYVPILLFFILGLMSKPMLVTLPCVMLLFDYWPLGRIKYKIQNTKYKSNSHFSLLTSHFPLFWEKLPLFALTAISCVITFIVQQRGGAVNSWEAYPLGIRISNALVSYTAYIVKMFYPARLAVLYPHPGVIPVWQIVGAVSLLISISFFVFRYRNYPYLTVGWLWYIGTLVPVIGLVQVGSQAMADRYTYIPLVGLFIMLAWGIPDFLARYRYKRIFLTAAGFVTLSLLMTMTSLQVRYWQNSISLFGHALKVTGDNYVVHNNIGNALAVQGMFDEAVSHYLESIRLNPSNPRAYNNMGLVLLIKGESEKAIPFLKKALQIKPCFEEAHKNLKRASAIPEKKRAGNAAVFGGTD